MCHEDCHMEAPRTKVEVDHVRTWNQAGVNLSVTEHQIYVKRFYLNVVILCFIFALRN